LADWGEPAYRSRQVYQAATRSLAADYDGMTVLPLSLRKRLAEAEPLAELEGRRLLYILGVRERPGRPWHGNIGAPTSSWLRLSFGGPN
jgi:hypothetical protein